MRKLLIVLVFMLGGNLAFSNNSQFEATTSEIAGICTVTITEYYSDGTTKSYNYTFETSTKKDCDTAGKVLLAHHQNMQE